MSKTTGSRLQTGLISWLFRHYRAIIILSLAVLTATILISRELGLTRPDKLYLTAAGSVDMCLSCHKEERLDPAHDAAVIPCSSCHLGNSLAVDKEEAHRGMVINPGDLRIVEKTCSRPGCHQVDAHKVKNSLMATNRGIIGTLLYYWGESDSQDSELTVEQLLDSGQTSFALDYYRKLCATCHLWKQKNDMPGLPQFFNEKGGGCTACHYQRPGEDNLTKVLVADSGERVADPRAKRPHVRVVKTVDDGNCIRCHNRSGRIGLAYHGIYESEGYGTPYEEGTVNSRQLPGARFYLEIGDDIHHAKKLACVDCHTREEIMGDGTSYAHYEEQLEISCQVCHSSSPGTTRKNRKLNNIERRGGKNVLVGKLDGAIHEVKPIKTGTCDFNGHKRVSCEACHSSWVAQCYGCHVRRDGGATHLDKLTLEKTAGQWQEGRSYIRYEEPMLGVWEDEIVVVTPGCQDIVTATDDKGEVEQAFNRFTMAAINPHTTQAKGRDCKDCHLSTRTMGLGAGNLVEREGGLIFEPLDQGVDTAAGKTVGFDQYVALDGTPLQHSSRASLRPFNGEELRRIIRVGNCLECHNSYGDPAWQHYSENTLCKRKS